MVIEYFMMTFMGIHRHSSSSRFNRGKSRRSGDLKIKQVKSRENLGIPIQSICPVHYVYSIFHPEARDEGNLR